MGKVTVANSHDLSVARPRRDLEGLGDLHCGERVVAPDVDPWGKAGVDPAAVVVDRARLSMDERACLRDPAAEPLDDRLVSEADAERRCRRAELQHELDRVAGVAWPSRTGRYDERVCSKRARLAHRDRVALPYHDVGAQLLEEVDEVVGKRVVVVDDEHAHRVECATVQTGQAGVKPRLTPGRSSWLRSGCEQLGHRVRGPNAVRAARRRAWRRARRPSSARSRSAPRSSAAASRPSEVGVRDHGPGAPGRRRAGAGAAGGGRRRDLRRRCPPTRSTRCARRRSARSRSPTS